MTGGDNNPKIERKIDLYRFISTNPVKNKTELCRKLGISRPTIYAMMDRLDVNDDELQGLFTTETRVTSHSSDIKQQLIDDYGYAQVDQKTFKGQTIIIVSESVLCRVFKGKIRLLPELIRGDSVYCSWVYEGKRITIKKTHLIYMLMFGVNEISRDFKIEFKNGNDKDFRARNLALVAVSKNSKEGQAKFLRELRNKTKIVSPESLEKFVADYFDL
tara:strand:+ start:7218 stop:7868 length:651 start_codon:yes stop_codon:yes gene_type:complete